jgi:hypothetical protein
MRHTWLLILSLIVGQAGCGTGEPSPRGKFGECYRKIKEDMTEAEVDEILAGYPKRSERRVGDKYGMHAKYLKRPSTYMIFVNEKIDPHEYDFFIQVYFDESHRVVGKEWSDY